MLLPVHPFLPSRLSFLSCPEVPVDRTEIHVTIILGHILKIKLHKTKYPNKQLPCATQNQQYKDIYFKRRDRAFCRVKGSAENIGQVDPFYCRGRIYSWDSKGWELMMDFFTK